MPQFVPTKGGRYLDLETGKTISRYRWRQFKRKAVRIHMGAGTLHRSVGTVCCSEELPEVVQAERSGSFAVFARWEEFDRSTRKVHPVQTKPYHIRGVSSDAIADKLCDLGRKVKAKYRDPRKPAGTDDDDDEPEDDEPEFCFELVFVARV